MSDNDLILEGTPPDPFTLPHGTYQGEGDAYARFMRNPDGRSFTGFFETPDGAVLIGFSPQETQLIREWLHENT